MISLICDVCEGQGLQEIEDGTEKLGLGGAKMHMRSLKRGATEKVSLPKLKKNNKNTAQSNIQKVKQQWWYVSVSALH